MQLSPEIQLSVEFVCFLIGFILGVIFTKYWKTVKLILIAIVGIVVLSTILTIFLVMIDISKIVTSALRTPTQVNLSFEQFDQAIQPQLNYLRINKDNTVINGRNPDYRYVIDITGYKLYDTYLFETQKYTFETGEDFNRFNTNICAAIDTDKMQFLTNPALEYFFKNVSSLKLKTTHWFIPELVYVIVQAYNLQPKKLDILIKGYADGQREPWEEYLQPIPYHYTEINILEKLNPNLKNSTRYKNTVKRFFIPKKYKNHHLPNLRAQFIKSDILSYFLDQCREKLAELEYNIFILNGDEYEYMDEKQRKVQFFLHFYENCSPQC